MVHAGRQIAHGLRQLAQNAGLLANALVQHVEYLVQTLVGSCFASFSFLLLLFE
jgi:hypothetical protein